MFPKLCTFRVLFFIYSFVNVARYITVGVIVAQANYDKSHTMDGFVTDCCDCYDVSKRPREYHMDNNKRFDLSHGIPKHADCITCANKLKHAGNESVTCPIANYTNTYPSFHVHWPWENYWNDQTGCPDRISMSTMVYWEKSYDVYAEWAIAMTVIYFIALTICILVVWCNKDRTDHTILVIYLYNVLFSEVYLYLYFKAFEFHHEPISYNNASIRCEISVITEELQDILGAIAFASTIAVIIQFIYTIYGICYCVDRCVKGRCICCNINCMCFCKCDTRKEICKCFGIECCNKNGGNYGKMPSVKLKDAKKIHHFGTISPCKHCCKCTSFSLRIIFALIMIALLLLTIFAFVVLAIHIGEVDERKDQRKIPLVLTFLVISFFDNPWIWKKINNKCQKDHNQLSESFDDGSTVSNSRSVL